jgi:retron-type reverse transcriptase
MSKDERGRNSSFSEKPVRSRPRRLADWINPTGTKKVHSLIDKVYQQKNLEMAWEKVKENRGSGGIDGQSLEAFEAQLNQQLERLHRDWVITCKSAAEARAAVDAARRILKQLGVELHPQKTRTVHVRDGFEFLGYKIKRGKKKLPSA